MPRFPRFPCFVVVAVLVMNGTARSQPCEAQVSPYLEATAWLGKSDTRYLRSRVESAFRISAGASWNRCGGMSYRLGLALGGFLALGGSPENSGLGQLVFGPELGVLFPSSGNWRFGLTAAPELSSDYLNGIGAKSIRLGVRAHYGSLVLGIDGIYSTGAADPPGVATTGVMFGAGASGKRGGVVIGIASGIGLFALIALASAISGGGD